jgi:hypothetical protein
VSAAVQCGTLERSDVTTYLSDPQQVYQDWGRIRRKVERAEPTPIATGHVTEPVTDLSQLPVIQKCRDLAAVLRIPASMISEVTLEVEPTPA